ncbi:MAG TPA: hypothetical protein VNZ86_07115 [Bacteroidia bacterium]|jgi:hypothetical protein|nr:hypothetical protein [Bacteroidia bacterium]
MRLFIPLFLMLIANAYRAQQQPSKPAYAGHLDYVNGNFGTYNYPVKADSIVVYVHDSTISFRIFQGRDQYVQRGPDVNNQILRLVKSKVYEDIIAPDKSVPTRNRDGKYTGKGSEGPVWLYLTHYGDGSMADLTLIQEDGVRLNNMFVAILRRLP